MCTDTMYAIIFAQTPDRLRRVREEIINYLLKRPRVRVGLLNLTLSRAASDRRCFRFRGDRAQIIGLLVC